MSMAPKRAADADRNGLRHDIGEERRHVSRGEAPAAAAARIEGAFADRRQARNTFAAALAGPAGCP
jgi:hypothetical protein